MRLAGNTERAIAQSLGVSVGTVNADLKALRQAWSAHAEADIAEHRARMLAEIEAVKKAGWEDKDLDVILKGLAQEAKLLGADAPTKTDITTGGDKISPKPDISLYTTEELKELQAIHERANARRSQEGTGES